MKFSAVRINWAPKQFKNNRALSEVIALKTLENTENNCLIFKNIHCSEEVKKIS